MEMATTGEKCPRMAQRRRQTPRGGGRGGGNHIGAAALGGRALQQFRLAHGCHPHCRHHLPTAVQWDCLHLRCVAAAPLVRPVRVVGDTGR